MMMCTDSTFKEIWLSYFNYETFEKSYCVNEVFLPPIVLLETALLQCKKLALRYNDSIKATNSYRKELEIKSAELQELKNKLDETREPCQKCDSLFRQLSDANKRAKEAETRVSQIAKILNVKDVESQSGASAMALVSQLLTESPKRKKRKALLEKDDNTSPPVYNFSTELSNPDRVKSIENAIIITETELPDIPKGPTKEDVKSRSLDFGQVSDKVKASPRKNRSADLQTLLDKSPKKIHFDICVRGTGDESHHNDSGGSKTAEFLPSPLDGSLLDYVKSSHSELDKIWFNDRGRRKDASPKKKSPLKKPPKEVWKMKKKFGPCGGAQEAGGSGKRMRQTTLAIAPPDKTVDISQDVSKHIGGESSDDDIILPSPNKEPACKSLIPPESLELTFDPSKCATSTQKTAKNLDNSFDLLVENKSQKSPNYKYKGKTVRGKEREKLPGWDCNECKEYYELVSRNGASKIKTINKCSRHRSKHQQFQSNTPPGFWDVDMPNSEEARKMYTSIHIKRPT